MNFHPIQDAFWWPIAWSIPGGLFGVAVGWILAGLDKPYGFQSGLMLGALMAWLTWIVMTFFWLAVLWRSYQPAPVVNSIEHITDAEAVDFDPMRIEIKCYSRGDDTHHYLINLPTEYSNLQRFAEGIERDHKTTAFSEWSGSTAGGFVWNDDQDYKAVIKWLCDKGYGLLDRNNKLVITDNGHDLFEDLLNPQFVPPPLSELGYRRNIRQYPNTNN